MAKVLFFPYPGGYGPLSNCASLADILISRHHNVAFAYAGTNERILTDFGYEVLPIKWPPPSSGGATLVAPFQNKPYRTVKTMDDFACMFSLNDSSWLDTYFKEQIRVIENWHPDILVGSWTFTLGLAGKLTNLPVAHIYQEPMYPNSRGFQWWEENKPSSDQAALPAFNNLLAQYGYPPVQSVEDFISIGDLLMVPSIPAIDPIDSKDARIRYVGHLVWNSPSHQQMPEWFDQIQRDNSDIIFVYEGGVRYGLRLYNAINTIIGGSDSQVIIATGMETPIEALPFAPSNIHYTPFVPALSIASKSRFVISHGAVGVTMLALYCGIPSIAIPTNTEREYYARRLATIGAGICLPFDTFSASDLADAIQQINRDGAIRQAAKKFGIEVRKLGGPQAGVDNLLELIMKA